MPGLSKVIVLDPDLRAGRQVQLGFEREGVPASAPPVDAAAPALPLAGDETGLVVVGGVDGQALELVRGTRKWLDDRHIDAPIVFAGRGVLRGDAEAAGADEVVLRPAYLRDVVTIGRLLRGVPAAHRSHLGGNLVDVTAVFTLVRAFAALGRSATLTLVRGLRRGEIRFYHGEVTSAQVGMIHGQAALHQLLLWTDARFDYHHEDVVRRHQIPLSHHELFADAERFLEGVRDSSGALSPSMVLEQDIKRVQSFSKQIPTEVYGVLRMFDGYRVLADVLEDSPYRVFETLRVAQRAVEAGLLRAIARQPVRATWRAVLAIEEWLVGGEVRGAGGDSGPIAKPPERDSGPTPRDSEPIVRDARSKSARKPRRKKKRRVDTPPAIPIGSPVPSEIDWGALVPRVVGAEVGPLSGVVPASHVSGEIMAAHPVVTHDTLDAPPKVVFDEAAELARDANARLAAEADVRARAAAERAEAERLAAEALAEAAAEARARAEAARAEADRAREAAAQADADEARAREARAREAAAQADADRAAAQADADRAADEARTREAAAQADADRAAAQADADRAAAQADADRAADEARAREAAAQADADRAADEARAREVAAQADVDRAAAQADADRAHPDVAPEAHTSVAAAVSPPSESPHVVDDLLLDDTKPERPAVRARLGALPGVTVVETAGVAVAETATATVVICDSVTVDASSETTARLTATPITRVVEAAPSVAGAPSAITDEPSDGVIRHHITTADTAPVKRRRLPSDPPEDDRPEDTMGEITTPRPRVTAEPRNSEPSILVADMAAIHASVSDLADEQATTPMTADAASPAREAAVVAARSDAVAFNEIEEAFFRAGHEKEAVVARAPVVESFDDLDEGYRPVGFWDRLRGKAPRDTARPAKPASPDRDPGKK